MPKDGFRPLRKPKEALVWPFSASRQAKDFDTNMKLGPGELLADPWQLTPIRDLVRLADRAPKWRVTI